MAALLPIPTKMPFQLLGSLQPSKETGVVIGRDYLLKKPGRPSAPKLFLDTQVVPLAVNIAGGLEVALDRAWYAQASGPPSSSLAPQAWYASPCFACCAAEAGRSDEHALSRLADSARPPPSPAAGDSRPPGRPNFQMRRRICPDLSLRAPGVLLTRVDRWSSLKARQVYIVRPCRPRCAPRCNQEISVIA